MAWGMPVLGGMKEVWVKRNKGQYDLLKSVAGTKAFFTVLLACRVLAHCRMLGRPHDSPAACHRLGECTCRSPYRSGHANSPN